MKYAALLIALGAICATAGSFAADTYTCPTLAIEGGRENRASTIDVYSGHPSEMAQLKPDNADTDDTSPSYWTMGPSKYDYWYVCRYEGGDAKREFKLPKAYAVCTIVGAGKVWDTLKCE